MSERKTSPWLNAAIAGCILLVLIGGYVGAYYATITPRIVHTRFGKLRVPFHTVLGSTAGGEWDHSSSQFFRPIHWLDRRIRPHVWEPTP